MSRSAPHNDRNRGAQHLVTAVRLAKQFLTYTSGAPLQPAIAMALGMPDDYFTGLRDDLEARRDQLVTGLGDIGFIPRTPAGGYFVTTDIRPLGFEDGLEFCRMLPQRVGVAAIPHQVFWDDPAMGRHLVRWAFCKQADVIDRGLDRLAALDPNRSPSRSPLRSPRQSPRQSPHQNQ